MSISKFDKQLLRRIIAAIIDVIIVIFITILIFVIISVINFLIFNLFKTSTYFIFPVIFYCYLGSDKASTIGMKLMNFQLRIKKGSKFTRKKALIHTSLFYLTLPIGIISLTYFIYPLLNDKRSCMHDLIYQTQFYEEQTN